MPDPARIIPWFGGAPVQVFMLSDDVAYCWTSITGEPDEPRTINHLMVWHNCTHSIWRTDPTKSQGLIDQYDGWQPTGVGAHDLITAEPLHIEASVYWPDCCGMHGFIRDGQWVSV